MNESNSLTQDEKRLLTFFRCLSPGAQHALLCYAGNRAVRHCLPLNSLFDLMPDGYCVYPSPVKGDVWDSDLEGTDAELIRDGIEAAGGPESVLLGSGVYDERETFAAFVRGAEETFRRRDFVDTIQMDSAFARRFILAWRCNIARACERVVNKMAKTVAEADAQAICVPEHLDGWIEFALNLDGEAIAEELDWPEAGDFDVDLAGTIKSLSEQQEPEPSADQEAISPVLAVRLALYQKLRFLQKHEHLAETAYEEEERTLDAESTHEREQILMALRWLREHMRH